MGREEQNGEEDSTSSHRGERACSHRPHSNALYKASASPCKAMLLCPHINGLAQQPPIWFLLPAFQGSQKWSRKGLGKLK